jgi:hypothetical protein
MEQQTPLRPLRPGLGGDVEGRTTRVAFADQRPASGSNADWLTPLSRTVPRAPARERRKPGRTTRNRPDDCEMTAI